MTEYVAGLLFCNVGEYVALIHKQKPKWQAGRWNAIGGKIETGETPQDAMSREFAEETGVSNIKWQPTAVLRGSDFVVHFFHAFDSAIVECRTMEAEQVGIYYVRNTICSDRIMPNLRVIMALALDKSGIRRPVEFVDDIPQSQLEAAA